MSETTRTIHPGAMYASTEMMELIYRDYQQERDRLQGLINMWSVDPNAVIVEGPVTISVACMLDRWQAELNHLNGLSLKLLEASIITRQVQNTEPLYITLGVL